MSLAQIRSQVHCPFITPYRKVKFPFKPILNQSPAIFHWSGQPWHLAKSVTVLSSNRTVAIEGHFERCQTYYLHLNCARTGSPVPSFSVAQSVDAPTNHKYGPLSHSHSLHERDLLLTRSGAARRALHTCFERGLVQLSWRLTETGDHCAW